MKNNPELLKKLLEKIKNTPDDIIESAIESLSEKNRKLTFNFKNITKINEEKNKMEISLSTDIFKDIEDAPFNMSVEIIGFFELEGIGDISHYEANAIAIMYPYLRTIISTYTSSANIMPIILSAININAVLNKDIASPLRFSPFSRKLKSGENKSKKNFQFFLFVLHKFKTYLTKL